MNTAKKIEYIKSLLPEGQWLLDNKEIIHALINALSPREAVELFDMEFKMNYVVRRWLASKISEDIGEKYEDFHKELIDHLKQMLLMKPFAKRDTCAYALEQISLYLPEEDQIGVLELFLHSEFRNLRERAYKPLYRSWDSNYQDVVYENWVKYEDGYCTKIIANHFPVEFLLENYLDLSDEFEFYLVSRMFIRMHKVEPGIVNHLKSIDEISYAYVLAKTGGRLTEKECDDFLEDNFADERIGLLIWCFGKMGLWEAILNYERNYKERTHQAIMARLFNRE